MSKLLTVRVKKSQWFRGQGFTPSKLRLEESGQQCCIGFLARALGARVKDIVNKQALEQVSRYRCEIFENEHGEALGDAYRANDAENISDKQRINKLVRIGKRMNVKFVFVP